MSLLTGIAAHHQTLPGLIALVANRAYPITAPQSPTYPYYAFQRVATPNRAGSHDGDSLLEQVRMQFSVRSKTALEADSIVDEIKTGYLGFKGMMGDVFVSGVTLANDIDDYDPTTKVYSRLVDVLLWHRPQE